MAIDKYLDKIEDILDDAVGLPLANGKKLVDVEKLKDLLDAVRLSIPQEIKDAKAVVSERNAILDDANAQAEQIIKKAETRARQLISQQEISKAADNAANELVADAQRRAREVEKAAMDFSENALKKSEDALLLVFNEVKNARLALRGKVGTKKETEEDQAD